MINLAQYTINLNHIVAVKWPDESTDGIPVEPLPTGATEVSNSTSVPMSKVAVLTLSVNQNGVPLTLIFDQNSDDYATLKEALGRR